MSLYLKYQGLHTGMPHEHAMALEECGDSRACTLPSGVRNASAAVCITSRFMLYSCLAKRLVLVVDKGA